MAFYHDMDKKKLRHSIENGTVEKYLQKVPVHRDDVFFIEAGTVHAIGAGALIAEIQENSNLTYRLYDYNRRDKQGKLRELHVDKALDVVDLRRSSEPRQPLRVLKYQRGWASELLCRCQYFQVERMLLNTESCREMADFYTDKKFISGIIMHVRMWFTALWRIRSVAVFRGIVYLYPLVRCRSRFMVVRRC